MKLYWLAFLLVPLLAAHQSQKPSAVAAAQTSRQLAGQTQFVSDAPTGETTSVKADAEQAIKHVLVSQMEAWNRGDLQGYMSGYSHSTDLTFFSGATVTKGWQPTLERYQKRYQGEGKEMGRLEFQDLNVDVLFPTTAVVTGKWQLTMSDGKQLGGLFTLVFKRQQDGWRIVHDHTSAG
ncbi:MAG TPA: nuclear transport factor 2 family protein [Verrucomicrobiae bacterium]|jgi:uncharacterized protein (TIGR02246 family)|nr:nuclear transport factor 2 family protein [Verrucomicrobiae bacterium]